MLKSINRKKAIEFYQKGYTVVVGGANTYPKKDGDDFLYISRSEHPFFPEMRVSAMRARYGQLYYWVCCVEANLGWNGQEYILREKNSGRVLHRIKGREPSVVRFLRGSAIDVANPGVLPQYYKTQLTAQV
jgi:hypothetical protein